ncbi:hypothetical protein G9A89_003193 [Geosiphon pyriformis]|nr:hypothetical protein G9A89_003193 [Geosiphon pyriformis]
MGLLFDLRPQIINCNSKEDNAQIWLNNIKKAITTNGWNDARALQAIFYFLQNTANSCRGSKRCIVATIGVNKVTSELAAKISNSKPLSKSKSLSTTLHSNSTTTNISNSSTSYLPSTATSNISTTTNSNAVTPSNPDITWKPKTENLMVVHQLILNSSNHVLRLCSKNSENKYNQNQNSQNYLSLLVAPEDASINNDLETSLKQMINNNIPLATITNNKLLAAIFLFKIKEPTETPLFSGAILDTKPITAMYTDVKVDGQAIKLILDSVDHAASTRIITADGTTKTPIGEINNFFIKVNALIGNDWLSKTNAMLNPNTQKLQLSQNGQHTKVPATCRHFKTTTTTSLIEFKEEEKKPTWEAYQVSWADTNYNELLPILTTLYSTPVQRLQKKVTTRHGPITIANYATMNTMTIQNAKTKGTCDASCQYTILINNWVSRRTLIIAAWHRVISCLDTNTKIEDASPSEILKIKNNYPEPVEVYCNKCDLIYNPTLHRIYMILEEEEPISSCASESDSIFNSNSKPNDNDNNGFSSIQNDSSNNNSDLNSDSDFKQYIPLFDLSKEQEFRWFSNNNKSIMPECVHDTDTRFDLRYPRKNAIVIHRNIGNIY